MYGTSIITAEVKRRTKDNRGTLLGSSVEEKQTLTWSQLCTHYLLAVNF